MQTHTGKMGNVYARDHKSGHTVFELRTETGGVIVCAGHAFDVCVGDPYEVTGEPESSRYGDRLRCHSIKKLYNRNSMIRYLVSVPYVGEATAKKIADEFGASFYSDIMDKESLERLESLKGINRERAAEIARYVRNDEGARRLWEVLGKYVGHSYSVVQKLKKQHGNEVFEKFTENPYELGMGAGLKYHAVDGIVLGEGYPVTDRMRVRAAVRGLLQKAEQAGHTYLPFGELLDSAQEWLRTPNTEGRDLSPAIIYINLAEHCDFVAIEHGCCYLKWNLEMEKSLAAQVKRLNKYAKKIKCDAETLCGKAELAHGIKYADKQRDAFRLLGTGGHSVITGGPGTGKTEVLKGLIEAYRHIRPKAVIKLAAPTGRASQRMKEVTGEEAVTVHRLLEFKQCGETVTHRDGRDPIEADLLVVDETSMLTLSLSDKLLSAVKPGTSVIFLGDTDQLPAIGAGNVLGDLIDSGAVPVVKLTKTYRQDALSNITKNKIKVRNGQTDLVSSLDFEILECGEEDMVETVAGVFVETYDKNDIYSCQVLSPVKRKTHSASTAQLNPRIQGMVNADTRRLSYGGVSYRVGDKVMLLRNNYDLSYFNGDLGTVTGVTKHSIDVQVGSLHISLSDELLDDISLAYATTIHKSQGSEYDTVVIALPPYPKNMLQRCLLYTAITRAKRKVVVVTTRGTLSEAIKNVADMTRHSFLVERLQDG